MANKTVLVVDDDDALRIPLARGLRNAEFNVLTAPDAATAQEIMKRIIVDAMVLDRMMVGMDGLTFLKQIRATGNTTPTIILTAMGGPENTIDGLMCGADDYLAKPFQLQELVLRLNNIINRTPVPQPQMPENMFLSGDEFFIKTQNDGTLLLALSGEEKKLLYNLTDPVGNIASGQPMVAKRLRNKLNNVSSNLDIVTVRGRGYKLVQTDKN